MPASDHQPPPVRGDKTSPPGAETPDRGIFGPSCLAQRIQAAAHGAIGSLPRTLRQRASDLWNTANLQRLTEAMGLWIRGVDLEAERFAHLFFNRSADDPAVNQLRDAASHVSSATDHAELSGGAEKIAAALQVIGLDRWPGFLLEVRDRAADPATITAVDDTCPPAAPPADPPGAEPPGTEPPGTEASGVLAIVLQPADDGPAPQPAHDAGPGIGRAVQLPLPGQAGPGPRAGVWPLPPPGITPPVRNPNALNPGIASRPSGANNGGQSLWDENGGEWRLYPADTWNSANWDYNEHTGPNSPWRTVPAPAGNPA